MLLVRFMFGNYNRKKLDKMHTANKVTKNLL